MKIENIIEDKLKEIECIENSVYPLVAPLGVKAPFIVYKKTFVDWKKTLQGTINLAEASYAIYIQAYNYKEVQNLTENIRIKLLELFGYRADDINIFDITVALTGDSYITDPEVFQSTMRLELKFKEV